MVGVEGRFGGCQEVLPDGAWAWATISEVCCGKSLFCDGCFLGEGKETIVVVAGCEAAPFEGRIRSVRSSF